MIINFAKNIYKAGARVSIFHDISEDDLPGLSGMSGEGIGIYPSHLSRKY